MYYLGIFESQPFETQSKMLDQLLELGQSDGRAIPMIKALVKKHLAVLRGKQMRPLLKLVDKFPALSKIWKRFNQRSELLLVAIKKAFNSNGIIVVKEETVLSLWQFVRPDHKTAILTELIRTVTETTKARWREYSALNILNPNSFIFQEKVDLTRLDRDFSPYATPVLVDLMLYLFNQGDDAQIHKAVEIQDFLIANRLHQFRSDLAIFHSKNPQIRKFLEPINERVSSRNMSQTLPEL